MKAQFVAVIRGVNPFGEPCFHVMEFTWAQLVDARKRGIVVEFKRR